jgi:hypothetical protein
LADAGGAGAGGVAFSGYDYQRRQDARGTVTPPPPFEDWLAVMTTARQASERKPAITASGLEGTEPDLVLAVDPSLEDAEVAAGKAKGARDLDLPPWTKGRYGSAIGRAVHAVLQTLELRTGAGLQQAVAAQALIEGAGDQAVLVRSLVESALASDVVRRAAAREHWREAYVGTTRPDGTILEGYMDLVYREDDGSLVVVDYKTDAIPAGAVQSRVRYYQPQMDAYCEALSAATGEAVSATLLFLHPTTAVAVPGVAVRPAS